MNKCKWVKIAETKDLQMAQIWYWRALELSFWSQEIIKLE